MVWEEVAKQYLEVFKEAQERGPHPAMVAAPSSAPVSGNIELPDIDLRHLFALTDDTGILQHALYATADRSHGYTTDDNARALIVAAAHWNQHQDETILPLLQRYLSFLTHALDQESGRFRNFMNYDRRWANMVGSEDAHGRALWGLGMCVGLSKAEPVVGLATRLIDRALPAVESFVSPRAWAFSIVGIQAYLQRFSGDHEARRFRALLADRLYREFAGRKDNPEWPWSEDVVTYCNAKLPHALLMAGKWMFNSEMIELGERALAWLLKIQTGPRGQLSLIGNAGWFPRGGTKARFDQQPIEAHALIDACIEAYNVTRQKFWLENARRCFHWFLGDNDLRMPLYDSTTGGCRDGLHADRANQNQGAESTIAWLLSLLLMHEMQTQQTLEQAAADKEGEGAPVATSKARTDRPR